MTSAQRADIALRNWLTINGDSQRHELNWAQYDSLIEVVRKEIENWPVLHSFDYLHPVNLQNPNFGVGKPYRIPLTYSDPGGNGEPLIAIGGLTNVTQRFDFLALDTLPHIRVIGLDLGGRGRSGWMAEISDYRLEAYVEQLRQLMDHLNLDTCSLLGSSLGGSTVISFAARYPERVRRIILNDSGPYIPFERRARRARAVGRHYVFRTPSELFRRTGASARHVGPTPDAILLHNSHNKTRWSDTENGRVYRHDLRAMLAYREEATRSLDLWAQWRAVNCPVLLLHGIESDATSDETIDQMREHKNLAVIHIHDTGHTPSLGDGGLTATIAKWVLDDECIANDLYYRVNYNPVRILYPDDRQSEK